MPILWGKNKVTSIHLSYTLMKWRGGESVLYVSRSSRGCFFFGGKVEYYTCYVWPLGPISFIPQGIPWHWEFCATACFRTPAEISYNMVDLRGFWFQQIHGWYDIIWFHMLWLHLLFLRCFCLYLIAVHVNNLFEELRVATASPQNAGFTLIGAYCKCLHASYVFPGPLQIMRERCKKTNVTLTIHYLVGGMPLM